MSFYGTLCYVVVQHFVCCYYYYGFHSLNYFHWGFSIECLDDWGAVMSDGGAIPYVMICNTAFYLILSDVGSLLTRAERRKVDTMKVISLKPWKCDRWPSLSFQHVILHPLQGLSIVFHFIGLWLCYTTGLRSTLTPIADRCCPPCT